MSEGIFEKIPKSGEKWDQADPESSQISKLKKSSVFKEKTDTENVKKGGKSESGLVGENLNKIGVKYDKMDKTEGFSKLRINFKGEKGQLYQLTDKKREPE